MILLLSGSAQKYFWPNMTADPIFKFAQSVVICNSPNIWTIVKPESKGPTQVQQSL